MGYIEQSTPDLDRVNGILFDMLVEHGVVKWIPRKIYKSKK
jgi:hypothetical protein